MCVGWDKAIDLSVRNVGHIGVAGAEDTNAHDGAHPEVADKFTAQFERVLQDYLPKASVEDEDGQEELMEDFLRGVDQRSAAEQLRLMAKDAQLGLPRAVLDVVADLVQIVAADRCESELSVPSQLVAVDWDSAYTGQDVLYVQRSTGKLRPCRIQQLQRNDGSVSVRFVKCGIVKTVHKSSLFCGDEEFVNLPFDYEVAYIGWQSATLSTREASVDGLLQRQLKALHFPFKKQALIVKHMPLSMRQNKKDQKTLMELIDQRRRNKVVAFKQQRKDGELSALQ